MPPCAPKVLEIVKREVIKSDDEHGTYPTIRLERCAHSLRTGGV